MKETYFAPSMMCADLLRLSEQIRVINEHAGFYHIDIMDGHYVKNITLSPDYIHQISQMATIPIDAHLMVEHPSDYLEVLANSGTTYISPHAETINKEAFRIIGKIHELGCKVGVALNPATPLSFISPYISLLDKITIMTVDPGFAGQRFIPQTLEKIREAYRLREENGYNYLIEADGGCCARTFHMLKQAGCNVYVLGYSGLFSLDKNLEHAFAMVKKAFEES